MKIDNWAPLKQIYSIFLGHSLKIALNNTALETIAKTTIKAIAIEFP